MNKPFVNPTADSAVKLREIFTPRGVRAWLVEDYAVPLVSLEFAFRGGASQDPPGKAGAATMLAGLLDEGAGDLDSQAFQRALDEKAIEISFHAERDHIGGRMRTLVRHLDRASDLLRLSLNFPRFDEEPFERVREQMNARLRHDAKDPGTMATRAWRARVFPGHAYALPSDGTVESLAAIERDDLKRLAAKAERRDAGQIAVGDFRGRVALDAEFEIGHAHAGSVVDDADEVAPARLDYHVDAPRARIERILDEFLHRRGGPLDHLAGGDPVDQQRIEAADFFAFCRKRALTPTLSRMRERGPEGFAHV